MDTLERLTRDPYQFLGVRRFINATCHWTRFGGTLIPDEVLDAMREAARHYVDIPELQLACGRLISRYTHAEDAIVVSGCAAAMLIGTAAVLTGDDPAKMMQLPDITGMKGECISKRFERRKNKVGREYVHYGYAHAVKTAGVKFIEVGDGDTVTRTEFEAGFGPQTAMVYWVGYSPAGDLSLESVISFAHSRGVPVLIDASNSLPPRENLHRFSDLGADLVCFSGGKGLQGPQGAGILAGRKDLIDAARMQAPPNQGIGRIAKVSKEEIVGQVAALIWWAEQDDEQRMIVQRTRAESLLSQIRGLRDARVELLPADRFERPYPTVHVKALPGSGLDGRRVVELLHSGNPPIAAMGDPDPAVVKLDVRLCSEEEIAVISSRLKEIFGKN